MSGKHSLEKIAVGLWKDISFLFSSQSLRQLLLLKYNAEFYILYKIWSSRWAFQILPHLRAHVVQFPDFISVGLKESGLPWWYFIQAMAQDTSQPSSSHTYIFYESFTGSQPLQLRALFCTEQNILTLKPETFVEINVVQPNEKSKDCLFRACYGQSQPSSLAFWQRLKSRQRSGKALQWTKGMASGVPWLDGGCWYEEDVGVMHRKQDGDMWLVRILRRLPFYKLGGVESITEECMQGSDNQVCTVI